MKILNIVRNKKGQFIKAWDSNKIKVICNNPVCKKSFETVESRIKVGKGKYCSKKCFYAMGVSESTRKIWSEQRKGKRISPKTEFTAKRTKGEKNFKWKGDRVGYFGIHTWLQRNYGKANKCENRENTFLEFECSGLSNNFDWAFMGKKSYERKRELFVMLCHSCHLKYDRKNSYTR